MSRRVGRTVPARAPTGGRRLSTWLQEPASDPVGEGPEMRLAQPSALGVWAPRNGSGSQEPWGSTQGATWAGLVSAEDRPLLMARGAPRRGQGQPCCWSRRGRPACGPHAGCPASRGVRFGRRGESACLGRQGPSCVLSPQWRADVVGLSCLFKTRSPSLVLGVSLSYFLLGTSLLPLCFCTFWGTGKHMS